MAGDLSAIFAGPYALAGFVVTVVALLKDVPVFAKLGGWGLRFLALAVALGLAALGGVLRLVPLTDIAPLGFNAWVIASGGVAALHAALRRLGRRKVKTPGAGLTQFMPPLKAKRGG